MMNILHLEDSDDDAELICAALADASVASQVTRVQTRQAFVDALDLGGWDIILADYSLPSFDGISALRLANEKWAGLPFIFVTGSLGEELAVETLKNGATDYILKHRLERLPQAVTRARRESEAAKAQIETGRKLEASLREKELLLQEVHHRVKNNLQIMSSLLDMQSDAIDHPILASAFGETQRRIHSMAIVHEMLYASNSLDDIDFADYAQMLAGQVSNAYGIDETRIRLSFEMEPVRLEIDRAIPCGLILNELLSNALKYAFPDGRGGEVRVSLRQQEGFIRLAVDDTGRGLPDGYHLRQTKSLGLNIVRILTKQLGGSMDITSDQGAHFVLTFAAA